MYLTAFSQAAADEQCVLPDAEAWRGSVRFSSPVKSPALGLGMVEH